MMVDDGRDVVAVVLQEYARRLEFRARRLREIARDVDSVGALRAATSALDLLTEVPSPEALRALLIAGMRGRLA